jgi:hypothetical protein
MMDTVQEMDEKIKVWVFAEEGSQKGPRELESGLELRVR